MVSSVDTLEHAAVQAMLGEPDAPTGPAPPLRLVFQPEVYFMGRTEGAGVVRDAFGRITRRCRVTTDGDMNPVNGSIRFREVFAYDDGEVDVWRWAMTPSRDGRYVAAESKAGAGITGERRGDDYLLRFRRPLGRAAGPLAPRFETRFTLLTPDTALKRAEVSLFGVPLGVLTALHRRIDA